MFAILTLSATFAQNNIISAKKKMFFKKSLFFFLPVLITGYSFSQKAVISGTIKDALTKQTLPGVVVFFDQKNVSISNENGFYELQVDAGNYTLKSQYIGYINKEIVVWLEAGEKKTLDLFLKNQARDLNAVVVSAGKFQQKIEEVTVSMAVAKAGLIENGNHTSMETALENITGLTLIDGQANIRGGSGFSYGAGSRVLVMVDELPMLTADANDVKWSFLPIENLEQVEIIKGASSALYGSAAMNGVINFRTAYAKAEPVTRLNVYTGWYDSPRRSEIKWWGKNTQTVNGANFFHAQKFNQFDLVIGSHYLINNGYREGEYENRYRANINTRYRFKEIEGLSAGVNANYMQTRGGNFILWADDSVGAYQPLGGIDTTGTTLSNYRTVRFNIDPFITYAGKKGTTIKWRGRYFLANNFNDTQQEAFSNLYYGELQFQKRIEKWNLSATYGLVLTGGDVMGDLYGYHESVNQSMYAQLDKKFFNRLTLSAGWRKERFKFIYAEEEKKPVYRAGANMRIHKATYVRASYGQGYRFPSIAERYVKTRVGDIVIYPNDSVRSETGWSAEAGLRQLFKIGENFSGYADACIFRSQYHDMLEFTFGKYGHPLRDPLFGLGFKSVNIGNTRIDGYEFEIGLQSTFGKVPVQFTAGYTYIDPILTDWDTLKRNSGTTDINVLKYRYRQLLKSDLQVGYKKFSAGVGCRYQSFMQNIDIVFNELIPGVKRYREQHKKGDWIFDARISYKIDKHLSIALVSQNFFNEEYVGRPADLQPPRLWMFQIKLSP